MVTERLVPRAGDEDTSEYSWASIWGFGPDDVYIGGQCTAGPCTDHGVIAHYDGTGWSMTVLEALDTVSAMFGTRSSNDPRRLWVMVGGPTFTFPPPPRLILSLPVTDEGGIGAPVFTKSVSLSDPFGPCSHFFGSTDSADAAWLSDGCLLYRWNGAELDTVAFSIDRLPSGTMNGIWAGGSEEAWIVGESIPRGSGFPVTGFAARRQDVSLASEGQP
jgi:hypothetical protein